MGALKQSKDLNVTNVIRQAFKNYDDKVRTLLDRKPYEKQKFWATIGAAIMQPGNAFANMAKGFKQAIDGLDADADTKIKMEAAILGEELKSEMKVAELGAKSDIARFKAITELDAKIATSTGKVKHELVKHKFALLKAFRVETLKTLNKAKASDVKNTFEEWLKTQGKEGEAAADIIGDKNKDFIKDILIGIATSEGGSTALIGMYPEALRRIIKKKK